jgi:hypothetical protein
VGHRGTAASSSATRGHPRSSCDTRTIGEPAANAQRGGRHLASSSRQVCQRLPGELLPNRHAASGQASVLDVAHIPRICHACSAASRPVRHRQSPVRARTRWPARHWPRGARQGKA